MATEGTAKRLSAFYLGFRAGLHRRYEAYVETADAVLDEPSTIAIAQILADGKRHAADVEALLQAHDAPTSSPEVFVAREAAFDAIVEGVA